MNPKNNESTTTVRLPTQLYRQVKHLVADGYAKSMRQFICQALETYIAWLKKGGEKR